MTRKDYRNLAQAVRSMRARMQSDPRLARVSGRAQAAIDDIIISELEKFCFHSAPSTFDALKFVGACNERT